MRKIFYMISSLVALIFLAIAFQNFSLQPQPLEISKDHDEMVTDLSLAIQTSDQDHQQNRNALSLDQEAAAQSRNINAIQHDPGEVYEGGPVSVDETSQDSLKQ